MLRECKHCGSEFSLDSAHKRRVGGRINECPDCVEELNTEQAPILIGVTAGEGKMAGVTVLRFPDRQRADAYMQAWRHSTGHNKGKSCQIGNTTTISMDTYGAQKVGEWGGNPNHKGRM